jgi:hypothetical protein
MRSLVDYLECGRAFIYKEAVKFEVTKLSDLADKILPFFQKYPLYGVKLQDYIYFVSVLELMKDKAHLTQEGIDKIREIKLSLYKEIIPNEDEPSATAQEQSSTARTEGPYQGTRTRIKSNKPLIITDVSARRTYVTASFEPKPLGCCQPNIRYWFIKLNLARLISLAPDRFRSSSPGRY